MTRPRISIVTPNYNGGAYLEQTILSVVTQGYESLEYIVVDGGSQDDSIDIIRRHEKNISYWCSESDSGQYFAIEKGFSRTAGEIMGWLNSDDILHPRSLFVVGEIFERFPDVQWLMGRPTFVDEAGRSVGSRELKRWSRLHFLMGDFRWIEQESVFWRRELWEKAGASLDTTLSLAADLELWNRFFQYADLHVTDALIGAFRLRREGQRSQEQRDEYLGEARHVLSRNQISPSEKRRIKIIRMVDRFLRRIPIIGRMSGLRRLSSRLWALPRVVRFNRQSQSFILSDR